MGLGITGLNNWRWKKSLIILKIVDNIRFLLNYNLEESTNSNSLLMENILLTQVIQLYQITLVDLITWLLSLLAMDNKLLKFKWKKSNLLTSMQKVLIDISRMGLVKTKARRLPILQYLWPQNKYCWRLSLCSWRQW